MKKSWKEMKTKFPIGARIQYMGPDEPALLRKGARGKVVNHMFPDCIVVDFDRPVRSREGEWELRSRPKGTKRNCDWMFSVHSWSNDNIYKRLDMMKILKWIKL